MIAPHVDGAIEPGWSCMGHAGFSALKPFVFGSGCHLEKPWVEVISVGVQMILKASGA
jgi:hypothetical protein